MRENLNRLMKNRGGAVLAGILAALVAVLLLVVYLHSYRSSVNSGKRPVRVLVGFTPGAKLGPSDPFADFRSAPKPMVLVILRFTVKSPGPRPKLRPTMVSPGPGFGSNRPYEVWTNPGFFGSVTIPGRALKIVVP